MDTYLSRPVLSMAIDWSENPTGRITYNLSEIPSLAGPESFWSDQVYVVNGWTFKVPCTDEDAIAELDAFFEDIVGRLNGFWLPAPYAVFDTLEQVSGTEFKVTWADHENTWDGNSELHLRLVTQGITTYAKVTGVVDNLDGTETVTIDTAVAATDETTVVSALQFVRLATDLVTAQANGEQSVDFHFECVELPHEYAAQATGATPIYLYHFWVEDGTTGAHWYLGNFSQNVTSGGTEYVAAPITHGALNKSMTGGLSNVTITSRFDITPFTSLVPTRIDQKLYVEILRASVNSISITTSVFFGLVQSVRTQGKLIQVECASVTDADAVQVPGFLFQPKCNHRLFGTACGKSSSDSGMKYTVTLSSLSADKLTVTAASGGFGVGTVANYFAEGMLEIGDDDGLQRLPVGASTSGAGGSAVLTLLRPISGTPTTATLYAGCDGSFGTCSSKFNNVANFGGHRFAGKNLALKAIDVPDVDAGKK